MSSVDDRWTHHWVWALPGLLLVVVIGVVDSVTGYLYGFSVFYLVPIAVVTWVSGRWVGIVVAFVSAVTAFVADLELGRLSAPISAYWWNAGITFATFLVVTLLLSSLKDALARETALAHTDYVTGAVNARFFFAMMDNEVARAQRSGDAFTIAYIDVDDFKKVNDALGHRTGDRVLRGVADGLKRRLRRTDVVARLGGDEFAVLLPATGKDAAQTLIPQVRRGLLDDMTAAGWPVTFSVGVLTCPRPPETVDGVMKTVDDLMYSVKRNGKNGVTYSLSPG